MVKTIQFTIDKELYDKITGLKSRHMWTWEDCVRELIKRCRI